MCSSLQDTLKEVFIWNNNPIPLSRENFAQAQCPEELLKIHNSPQNLYFQARFLACAQASAPYCFIQDDDYFIKPSIIRAMRARMEETNIMSLHLLPSHEMLFSQSSAIKVDSSIHTLFAWLGYGTMTSRSRAQEFIDLLVAVNATEDVFKMADNYFTILANGLPELWFDQNYELGGGTPFTVGVVGEERNNRHIVNAGVILDSLALRLAPESEVQFPYISLQTSSSATETMTRAACKDMPCIMETNIEAIPNLLDSTVSSASEIIAHTMRQFQALSTDSTERFLQCSPSFAVDVDPETSFCSASGELNLGKTEEISSFSSY
ncbi:hypothetical protein AN958_06699 [Leucoagaricus sp. SymC.cos]|nr:hypothetical protein AN958_06699 [Leucoagaricus sp. SymC.cos]